MSKNFRFASLILSFVLCFTATAFGQETVGSVEVTVKDPQGAVVPNVSVTIESSRTDKSSTAGYKRTVTTDDEGFQRVLQVPPGIYTVTAAPTAGFAEKVVGGVQVSLGKVTPVQVDLGVASSEISVDINTEDVSPIDTTDTKLQTTVSAQQAELLPKGPSFASLLKISPATRPEPLSGQFQIDGASGSENTFIVDGQEVTNARTGVLNSNNNLPFSLVQEFQVKSSGFEAEFGGATGGVVNVVTRGGNNQLRGEFGLQFRPSKLQPKGRDALFLNTNGQAEYFPAQRDSFLEFNPTATLGGPIIKDRVWFFGAYTPQIFTRRRTINYIDPTTRRPTGESESYRAKSTNEYAFLRIDAQPISKIRMTGVYTYNPISVDGAIPGFTTALEGPLTQPGGTLRGAAFLDQTGGRQNAQQVTGSVVYTPTNNLVLSARAGHFFLNEKLGSYGAGNAFVPRQTCSAASPTQFPAGFGCVRGQGNNLPVITIVSFDATERNTFDADATFITSLLGRHEFKGGYQYNGLSNQLLSQTTSQIVLRFGQSIAAYSGRNIPSAPNALGAGLLRQFREQGDVSSKNEGIFIQDKYQPFNRLTLNLGFRTERENVPSFNPTAPDLKFNFKDKIAPRLGAAFDLTGDGKTKVSAFYGWFYDRFKYELPRGSFGGQFFHDFFFEILPGDTLASLTEATITGGGTPTVGGRCPNNTTTPIFGRVRCDIDYRVPSNSGLGLEFGAVDPDIKAFRQSEFTLTFERDLGRNFVFSSRYTRKQVDETIEDAGFFTTEGSEAYVIGNPGRGLYAQIAERNGLLALDPQRQYDALEFRLDRRFANDYYFNLNYTYSRLYGNYSGLASSDEDGRLSPNVNRFFDLPHAGFTVAGGPDNGRLPTDRPHVLKFAGAYSLDWTKRFGFGANNTTEFQVFTTAASGTPLTTTVDIFGIDTIVLDRRGDLGRTATFTETDFGIRHRYRFGRDNRFTLIGEADILNIFNEANEVSRNNLLDITDYDLTDPALGLVTAAQSTQPNAAVLALAAFQRRGSSALRTQALANRYALFNRTNAFQAPRQLRFGFRLLF